MRRSFKNFAISCLIFNSFTAMTAVFALNVDGQLIDPQISTFIEKISEAGAKGQEDILQNLISDQYLETKHKLDALFKRKSSFSKDFSFYEITSINRFRSEGDVAFIEVMVKFHPDFLAKHPPEKNNGASLWSNLGGYGLAKEFQKAGTGLATYYLVKQHHTWRLHYSYFSLEPISDYDLSSVGNQMKSIADPKL